MAKPSFDEFTDMLDQAINRIPPQFCRDLTGGFNVQKGKKREDGYYILGEYVEDGHLGCFIVFYYGSFVELLVGEDWEAWEAEIMDTVLHEMQHHLEAQAGRDDLARKEIEELARALRL
jgi:predicted Zn-dependent protease with MMP-like domain